MRAFSLGQRIRVETGPAAGLSGVVVRLRRGDDLAWVRMDTREEREGVCWPFFADDEEDRGSNLLLAPEDCGAAPGIPGRIAR